VTNDPVLVAGDTGALGRQVVPLAGAEHGRRTREEFLTERLAA
jgi:hypothetical protein